MLPADQAESRGARQHEGRRRGRRDGAGGAAAGGVRGQPRPRAREVRALRRYGPLILPSVFRLLLVVALVSVELELLVVAS